MEGFECLGGIAGNAQHEVGESTQNCQIFQRIVRGAAGTLAQTGVAADDLDVRTLIAHIGADTFAGTEGVEHRHTVDPGLIAFNGKAGCKVHAGHFGNTGVIVLFGIFLDEFGHACSADVCRDQAKFRAFLCHLLHGVVQIRSGIAQLLKKTVGFHHCCQPPYLFRVSLTSSSACCSSFGSVSMP